MNEVSVRRIYAYPNANISRWGGMETSTVPDSFPLQVLNAYSDLLERHRGRPRSKYEGSFRKKVRGEKAYWEVRRRIGARQKTEYVGPDTAETRAIIDEQRILQEADKRFRRGATRLVQMVVSAGVAAPDRETGALLRAIAASGAFDFGAVLIGTHAYRLYESVLGVELGAADMATEDVDLAREKEVQVASGVGPSPKLTEVFEKLDFEPQLSRSTPEGVWQWRSSRGALLVEFLTPQKTDRTPLVELSSLGVHAMQLRFLELLLKDPIDAVALYQEGVRVRVPNPVRFAIHKLIVSVSRGAKEFGKIQKDIQQAVALLDVLVDGAPFEVEEIWNEATATGPRWRKALTMGAKALPKDLRTRLEELELS